MSTITQHKTIIAVSRGFTDLEFLKRCLAHPKIDWVITELVSGGARGVDRLGEAYATEHGIPIKKFPPDWNKYGRRAGLIRNVQMAEYADALIALWDGQSSGTGHMISVAVQRGLKVVVFLTEVLFEEEIFVMDNNRITYIYKCESCGGKGGFSNLVDSDYDECVDCGGTGFAR